MTTITFKEVATGKTRIECFTSLDQLRKILVKSYYDVKDRAVYVKNGKKLEEIIGVSFDEHDEAKKLLQNFHVIPQDDDYN